MQVPTKTTKGIKSTGVRVTGDCELPEPTQVLCRVANSLNSQVISPIPPPTPIRHSGLLNDCFLPCVDCI